MSAFKFVFVWLLFTLGLPALGATYHDPHGAYTFKFPTGWKVTSLGGSDAIASDGGAAYVRIVHVPGGGKDKALVDHFTEQVGTQWQNFKQNSAGSATLSRQRGIYVFFTGINPKGVAAVMRIVAAPFGDDAWMLIMSAPNADFVLTQEAFKQIEFSFTVGGGATPAPGDANTGEPTATAPTESAHTTGAAGEGHVLQGALQDVSSGPAAFKAGLHHTRGVFDASINLLSVARSKDNPNLTMASFTAAQQGAPVGGLVIAVYDPAGHSRFALLYDAPDRLAKSLPTMLKRFDAATQERLEKARPQGGSAAMDFARFEKEASHVALNRTQFQDGTASIGVAPGFKPTLMSGGRFTASASDGAYITLFRPCNVLDPNGTLYKMQAQLGRNVHSGPMHVPGQVILAYDPDLVSAWKNYIVENARQNNAVNSDPQVLKRATAPGSTKDWPMVNIAGTMTVNGEPFVFTGMLVGSPPPTAQGGWSVQVTLLAAPAAHAAVDMPAMIAMQQSEKVDMSAVQQQTMHNIAAINAQTSAWLRSNKAAYDEASQRRFDSAMANAHASRDAMDRSTAGFIHYISNTSVLQHNPTGARATVDANLASALEKADPQNLSVISSKDYIKGVDY
jgi:hypothetical protein